MSWIPFDGVYSEQSRTAQGKLAHHDTHFGVSENVMSISVLSITTISTIKSIKTELAALASKEKQKVYMRFFKTGRGEYGEGDQFIGLTVPDMRKVANEYYQKISLGDCVKLLHSKIHEERLCALTMMVSKYEKSRKVEKEKIYKKYLANTKYINNWDLVDTSCYKIVGQHLIDLGDWSTLKKLAKSESLWERRIAIVSTFAYLKIKNPRPTVSIANLLLLDKHDLIHKGIGWMLREMGKRVGESSLISYLDKCARLLPRTSLRYAIERLPETKSKYYLNLRS